LALYQPRHGYYQQARWAPGRSGDFLTSPEASPYFGLTVARQLIEVWDRLGQPDGWEIREFGAGHGVLAYDILAESRTMPPRRSMGCDTGWWNRIRTAGRMQWPP